MLRKCKYFLLLLIICFPFVTQAADAPTQLVQILNNLHTLQANFTQTIVDGHGNVIQQTAGAMALEKPGKFLWQTKTPNQQLLIADGDRIWFYDVDLEQATVQNQHNVRNSGSPAMLLEGSPQTLLHDFSVTQLSSSEPQSFSLQPKNRSGLFQAVQLIFKNNQLQAMRMQDNLGQTTHIEFTQIQLNAPLNAALFKFKPPQGVDVVHQ